MYMYIYMYMWLSQVEIGWKSGVRGLSTCAELRTRFGDRVIDGLTPAAPPPQRGEDDDVDWDGASSRCSLDRDSDLGDFDPDRDFDPDDLGDFDPDDLGDLGPD